MSCVQLNPVDRMEPYRGPPKVWVKKDSKPTPSASMDVLFDTVAATNLMATLPQLPQASSDAFLAWMTDFVRVAPHLLPPSLREALEGVGNTLDRQGFPSRAITQVVVTFGEKHCLSSLLNFECMRHYGKMLCLASITCQRNSAKHHKRKSEVPLEAEEVCLTRATKESDQSQRKILLSHLSDVYSRNSHATLQSSWL